MSAETTGLFFGRLTTDGEAAKIAADRLRSRGHAVTEELRGTQHVVVTYAPYKVAIEAKRYARWAIEQARTAAPERLLTREEFDERRRVDVSLNEAYDEYDHYCRVAQAFATRTGGVR